MAVAKKLKKLLAIVLLLSFFFQWHDNALAINELSIPQDTISNNHIKTYAEHTIRFALPTNADAIHSTDYIIISMPYFSGTGVPTYITGNYLGTPTFSHTNNRVTITGISVDPGNIITIFGIGAFNPIYDDLFDVYINVAGNADGSDLKDYAHVIATSNNNSVTVTAEIEAQVGTLIVSGIAAPGMFITFTEGNSVIGTCTAGQDGTFTKTLPGMLPVTHSIQIFGVDQYNRTTPPTTIEVLTRAYETTTVSGVLLPPTISTDKDAISRGENITLQGMAPPGFKVKLFTEPPFQSFEATAGGDGTYSYTITDTSNFEFGDHKAYAISQDGLGTQSMLSTTAFFKVLDGSVPGNGETPSCDIAKGDLNCDSIVNLTDFSIILYYWGGNTALADINKDGNVNLVDFSIMMFYWNG